MSLGVTAQAEQCVCRITMTTAKPTHADLAMAVCVCMCMLVYAIDSMRFSMHLQVVVSSRLHYTLIPTLLQTANRTMPWVVLLDCFVVSTTAGDFASLTILRACLVHRTVVTVSLTRKLILSTPSAHFLLCIRYFTLL